MKKEFGPQGWRGNGLRCFGVTMKYRTLFEISIAERAQRIAVATIEQMTDHFKFRCPLTGEAKLGANWAETH
jgi:hypothetical protein